MDDDSRSLSFEITATQYNHASQHTVELLELLGIRVASGLATTVEDMLEQQNEYETLTRSEQDGKNGSANYFACLIY